MMADNNQRTSTSTQIRNMYSDGMAYMNIKFYNTNLSLQLYPFTTRDANGRSSYDMKNGQMTTINFEGAYALVQVSNDILNGKVQETSLQIPCAAGASLTLERKMNNGGYETTFTIMKNNITIPFKFTTIQQQVKENGQFVTKTIESGLGAFMKTVDGYLVGINADRHLDKLTEDFVKAQEANTNPNGGAQGNYQQNGYNNNRNYNNNGYKKPYQNNGYKKPYQPNNNYGNNQFPNPSTPAAPAQQDMSTYSIPN